MVKYTPILATQYEWDDIKSPLLPPNQFTYIDSQTLLNITNATDASSLYQQYKKFNSNQYNRRKFVDGALYTKLFHDSADVIYPLPNRMMEINVLLHKSNEQSTIMIYYDTTIQCNTLRAMTNLGVAMNLCKDNTNRATKLDNG